MAQPMKHRQLRTAAHDNREAPERTCEAYGEDGHVCVRVGRRKSLANLRVSEARAILSRLGRQPAPIIWRALGVEA